MQISHGWPPSHLTFLCRHGSHALRIRRRSFLRGGDLLTVWSFSCSGCLKSVVYDAKYVRVGFTNAFDGVRDITDRTDFANFSGMCYMLQYQGVEMNWMSV